MKYSIRAKQYPQKPIEVWQQDLQDHHLWHGENGVMVNEAALKDREFYFDIVRVSIPHILYTRKHSTEFHQSLI